MKNAMKKLLSLMLVAVLLVSAVPFKASATGATGFTVNLLIKDADNTPLHEEEAINEASGSAYTVQNYLDYYLANWADNYESTGDKKPVFWVEGHSYVDADHAITENARLVIKLTAKEAPSDPPATTEATEAPTAATEAPVVEPIKIVVKVDSSDNVVWTGEKVPANGESATVQNLLNYCWNSSWEDVYTFDHAYSHAQGQNVALTGSINAGDTVYIMVSKKVAATTPTEPAATEPAPTEPEIDDSVDIVVGNGDKRILVTLDWNVTGMKDNYVRVTDPNTKMGTVMEAIQKSGLIPKRTNYTFAGWYWDDDFDYPVKDNEYVTDSSTTNLRIYARWTRNASADNVFLKIYLNGKTSSPAKIVDISSYGDADGSIDIYEAKRAAGNYYSSTGYDGLFTDATWNGGAYNNSDQTDSVAVNANGDTFIYIMLWGAKTTSTSSSSSSSSSGTADTSNPKTGDTVYMVMTVMGLSAAALAAVYYVSKKRAF